jgi:hypothetical protein
MINKKIIANTFVVFIASFFLNANAQTTLNFDEIGKKHNVYLEMLLSKIPTDNISQEKFVSQSVELLLKSINEEYGEDAYNAASKLIVESQYEKLKPETIRTSMKENERKYSDVAVDYIFQGKASEAKLKDLKDEIQNDKELNKEQQLALLCLIDVGVSSHMFLEEHDKDNKPVYELSWRWGAVLTADLYWGWQFYLVSGGPLNPYSGVIAAAGAGIGSATAYLNTK